MLNFFYHGIVVGFALYIFFSLLGYGFYSAINLFKKGG